MIPTVFELGPIPIYSFGLMIALMFVAAVARLGDSFDEVGIDRKLAENFIFYGVLSGLIGARIWFIVEDWEQVKGDIAGAIFSGSGFTFYGGFVAALLIVTVLCKKNKITLSKFFDAVGPTLALGYAIGRLGCQLSGDGDYGITTTSWLGMSYSSGVVPTPPGVLVLPTPLYESTFAILICLIVLNPRVKSWLTKPWQIWGLTLALLSLERFLVEFIRIKQKYGGLSEAHYFSILFLLVGLFLIIRPALFVRTNTIR
jgi:phosphatidylglycerol:prolipoprotein diacylglycerol transferase